MHCPFCNAADSKVIDSRLAAEGCQIRRRRECTSCGERFTTFESYEVVMPRVIKSNGRNDPFDEQKLNEMKDAELLNLCLNFNLISEEAFFFLDQCRNIRNNFSAAHPSISLIDDR